MAEQPEDPNKNAGLVTFTIYSTWNILRYITVGILIYYANERNTNDIQKYKPYCCDCYFVSLDPTRYNSDISDDKKFDLSYCIPSCTDCNHCKSLYQTANDSFNDLNFTNANNCPVREYVDTTESFFNWDWKEETGCNSHISITSLYLFAKSYSAYGTMAIVISVIYSLGLIGVIFTVYTIPSIYKILLRWILIYNILISEIFLYFLFKPFQYYHQNVDIILNDGATKQITCEINSIHDKTADLISWVIFISIPLMLLHMIYVLYRLCGYCSKCIKSYKNENRNRQESVSLDANEKINYGAGDDDDIYYNIQIRKHQCRWGVCGIFVSLIMFFFIGIVIYATVDMIKAGHDQFDDWKRTWIVLVTILLFLSVFDNPWVFQKLKSFFWDSKKPVNESRKIMLSSHSL